MLSSHRKPCHREKITRRDVAGWGGMPCLEFNCMLESENTLHQFVADFTLIRNVCGVKVIF